MIRSELLPRAEELLNVSSELLASSDFSTLQSHESPLPVEFEMLWDGDDSQALKNWDALNHLHAAASAYRRAESRWDGELRWEMQNVKQLFKSAPEWFGPEK